MAVILNEKLNAICVLIHERVAENYPFILPIFDLMFWQGCRFCDAKTFNIISSTEIITVYKPCKKQVAATSIPGEASDLFHSLYLSGFADLKKYSYSSHQKYFNICSQDRPLHLNGKAADLHIFRYNRIRQLFDKGLTEAEITSIYGWADSRRVTRYLTTPIYTP
jgi:hypothetical protein